MQIMELNENQSGTKVFSKILFFFLIINFAAVEDIVIRSILSTKEKLQTQWKTVVVRKIEYSSTIFLGQLSLQLLYAAWLRYSLGQPTTSSFTW